MLAAVLLALQTPSFDFDYKSGSGLSIVAQGVPLVRGSWFQVYDAGWTHGYYMSLEANQKVSKPDADTIQVEWADGQVSGDAKFHRNGETLAADYRFAWSGDHPVYVETTAGMVWAPAFEMGSLLADGKPTRSLTPQKYSSPSIEERRFSPNTSTYQLTSPVANLTVTTDRPHLFFDARGYNQSWAIGNQLWWLGAEDLKLEKDKPVTVHVEWKVSARSSSVAKNQTGVLKTSSTPRAVAPDETIPPLIPKPTQSSLDFSKPMQLTGSYSFPAGRFRFFSEFTRTLANRFVVPTGGHAVAFDGGVSKLGMTPGGYRIIIRPTGVSVLGEEEEGLRNGLRRVAMLAFVKDGKLCLPQGELLDNPQSTWRGVHLFVGPTSKQFQQKLFEKVLLPLGINQVVLQCENTAWKAAGSYKNKATMTPEELASLWAMYREHGIEPIPLIQSWGHMEWLLQGNRYQDLKIDPRYDWSMDPRKPEMRKLITSIWDEAIDLLHPKIAHFGLDEVHFKGYDDPEVVTKSWEDYVPFLANYAKSKGVQMMIWGDQMLAPDEAPDAGQAPDKAHSARRRAAVPKGTFIGDWHYLGDNRFHTFTPVLQMWLDAGMVPIASGWYIPDNVAGLAVAADIRKVGYLQTTWAGYESSEATMIPALNQFSAMVLAADYSWSARPETPDKLPYDPVAIFRKMYFDPPAKLTYTAGLQVPLGKKARSVNGVSFLTGSPIALRAVTLPGGDSLPQSVTYSLEANGSMLDLALDTAVVGNDGEAVAEITVTMADGRTVSKTVKYGADVRAASDPAGTSFAIRQDGLALLRLPVNGKVKSLSVKGLNSYVGLRVQGITLEALATK